MYEDLIELFGSLIILFYGLTVANFFFKFILRKFRKQLMKKPKFFKIYTHFVKFFVKYHRFFGFATVLFIIVHFITMYFYYKVLSITGLIAAGMMIVQVILGVIGKYAKPKTKTWLWIHRGIAFLLVIAILIHV